LDLPKKLLNAVDEFSKIPGIGEKTALRHILTMSRWDQDDLESFSNRISELATLCKCDICGMYADENICEVCKHDERRSSGTICVVESVTDCLAIERSGSFVGTYHITEGVLNPLLGVGPDELNFQKLFDRVKSENVETLLLAINPSVEGDATCSYIKQYIGDDILVERIGFGIPMGGSLEFLDSMTINKAMENRKRLD
jgi:recombination protein RecR